MAIQDILQLNLTATQSMFVLTDNPIDCIMVVKGHEGKAPLFSGITISHNINDLNFAKLLEVVPQM